ncbi:flavodoxin [Isobaculum melis]|uniref:Flavodoxin n=1 Tax=Isobaculum melis TaxID=142588 RepID=A0A1H9S7S9_9LACT|nr:flavodoxin [Isobaculum melis]SER81050.1 flavodoxin I [Isobaculum melis]
MKVKIVYGSVTGNTEEMAEFIKEGLEEKNIEVDLEEGAMVDDVQSLEAYDGVLLGSCTYDGGYFPGDYQDFYEDLADIQLSGKKAAAFGSGDTFYEQYYCVAVNFLEERLKEIGAEVVLPGLKIDLQPDDEMIEQCKQFGRDFGDMLR